MSITTKHSDLDTSTFAGRIQRIKNAWAMSDAELRTKAGFTPREWKYFEENNPSQELIDRFTDRCFEINKDWFVSGYGDPFIFEVPTEFLSEDIGKRVKEMRLKNNLIGEEFGKLFDKSKIWTHHLESGRHKLVPHDMRIMKAKFGVSYEYLIDGVDTSGVSPDEVRELKRQLEKLREEVRDLKSHNRHLSDYLEILKQPKIAS